MNLQQLFYPIIGMSYKNDPNYFEFPPHEDLKPYIRCFWGSLYQDDESKTRIMNDSIVIPDACVDIIFNFRKKENRVECNFYGIDDEAMLQTEQYEAPDLTFGIRFYGWAVAPFMGESLEEVISGPNNVDRYFPGIRTMVESGIYEGMSIGDLIRQVEMYLRTHYNEKLDKIHIKNAIADMILSYGSENVEQIAVHNNVSKRTLERGFKEYVGISPKKMAGIIRYQYVWQDLLYFRQCKVDDMLDKYKYVDQAHLLNDFKNHHGMNWKDALRFYQKSMKE
ncbi:MAG: AraC family transcriptional regulator [Clostridiales bacterium]|nr:AraC family transcriptional regulator [Clostridiales bacterium]